MPEKITVEVRCHVTDPARSRDVARPWIAGRREIGHGGNGSPQARPRPACYRVSIRMQRNASRLLFRAANKKRVTFRERKCQLKFLENTFFHWLLEYAAYWMQCESFIKFYTLHALFSSLILYIPCVNALRITFLVVLCFIALNCGCMKRTLRILTKSKTK